MRYITWSLRNPAPPNPGMRVVPDVRLILTREIRVFHALLILVASVPSQESAD